MEAGIVSERARAECGRLYRPALSQFWNAHGGITDSFYANEFAGGVVLTGSGRLFSSIWWDGFDFDTTAARAVEADVNDLRVKADLYLSRDHRRLCMERLMRLYKALISSLRDEYLRWSGATEPSDQHLADLEQIRTELQSVKATYRRVGAGRGAERYTRAALLSVLQRLTSGRLRVRFEAERASLGGVSRPVVGAISGLALYALVGGGIIPLDEPSGETARGLFYCGVGFIAGFSERFAKDVFGSAAGTLGGQPGAEPPTDGTGRASPAA